jgi:hypothetical protein
MRVFLHLCLCLIVGLFIHNLLLKLLHFIRVPRFYLFHSFFRLISGLFKRQLSFFVSFLKEVDFLLVCLFLLVLQLQSTRVNFFLQTGFQISHLKSLLLRQFLDHRSYLFLCNLCYCVFKFAFTKLLHLDFGHVALKHVPKQIEIFGSKESHTLELLGSHFSYLLLIFIEGNFG